MFDRRAVCVKLGVLNVSFWDGTTLCGAPSEQMREVTLGPSCPTLGHRSPTRLRIKRTRRRVFVSCWGGPAMRVTGPMPQVDLWRDIKTIAD
jgi:hypothetical protein